MTDVPLLSKEKSLNVPNNSKGKMKTALKEKLVDRLSQTLLVKAGNEEDFWKSLNNRDEEKARIEKEMHYVEDLYRHAGYFTEFQDNYLQEIEKNLKTVENNTKQTANTLKQAKKKSACIQKFLYSVISVQVVVVITLLTLIWLF